MTTKEKIAEELKALYIRAGAETPTSPEDILSDLRETSALIARSAELTADAEYHLNVKRGEVAEKSPALSATQLREYMARETAQEMRLYRLSERLVSSFTHRLDALRTQISYEKEQMSRG